MRETRLSGSEGGGIEFNRFSLPLSSALAVIATVKNGAGVAATAPIRISDPLCKAHRGSTPFRYKGNTTGIRKADCSSPNATDNKRLAERVGFEP
jgi:hypothetical protein